MKNFLLCPIYNLKYCFSTSCAMVMLFSLNSCDKAEDLVVEGLAPIVLSYDDVSRVVSASSRPFVNTGKIVSVGNYIFINEEGKGIHVLDNTIPTAPINLYFWEILGNFEFTIDGNFLFADNSKHIFVIDITDFKQLLVVDVIKDVYDPTLAEQSAPPDFQGWFQCYDAKAGILIGWEKKLLTNPLCHTR